MTFTVKRPRAASALASTLVLACCFSLSRAQGNEEYDALTTECIRPKYIGDWFQVSSLNECRAACDDSLECSGFDKSFLKTLTYCRLSSTCYGAVVGSTSDTAACNDTVCGFRVQHYFPLKARSTDLSIARTARPSSDRDTASESPVGITSTVLLKGVSEEIFQTTKQIFVDTLATGMSVESTQLAVERVSMPSIDELSSHRRLLDGEVGIPEMPESNNPRPGVPVSWRRDPSSSSSDEMSSLPTPPGGDDVSILPTPPSPRDDDVSIMPTPPAPSMHYDPSRPEMDQRPEEPAEWHLDSNYTLVDSNYTLEYYDSDSWQDDDSDTWDDDDWDADSWHNDDDWEHHDTDASWASESIWYSADPTEDGVQVTFTISAYNTDQDASQAAEELQALLNDHFSQGLESRGLANVEVVITQPVQVVHIESDSNKWALPALLMGCAAILLVILAATGAIIIFMRRTRSEAMTLDDPRPVTHTLVMAISESFNRRNKTPTKGVTEGAQTPEQELSGVVSRMRERRHGAMVPCTASSKRMLPYTVSQPDGGINLGQEASGQHTMVTMQTIEGDVLSNVEVLENPVSIETAVVNIA
mmetsp:Transcript_43727/g.52879  ORF Transcript_43727/g.52879 Transcript_43727/m.52879 type:complete len:587 (-) Transcript_43727:170-1930(-)|eukprot:CAMPEP_0197857512 /NCGR_PEP_ID=MMETSP1438-20131217/30649_1 /TAXON_ID=1461541 /ORGANISM="Pterosperma sp., Strain CCMP1384" /LENGTH=586 /DNA_ID=CAMNT_0043473373 /DNA_START=260 /DNA_END=2020 /DNA_ORIENTATION=-